MALEQRRRDDGAVGAGDDHVRRQFDALVEPLRLEHRNAEPLGDLLRGRRARACRPRPAGRSGLVRQNAISCRAASRSRTSAPNGAVAANPIGPTSETAASAGPRRTWPCASPAGLLRRPVDHEHPVEVVELVLGARARESLELERDVAPAGSLPSTVTAIGRSTGTSRPWRERQPSSSVSSSSPCATISGLTSARSSPSSLARMTNTRRSTPTCVAARPAAVGAVHQRASCAGRAGRARRRTTRPPSPACVGRGPGTGGSARARRASEPRARDPAAPPRSRRPRRPRPSPRPRRSAWCRARSPRRQCTPRPGATPCLLPVSAYWGSSCLCVPRLRQLRDGATGP